MSGTHIVENTNTEKNTNISRTTASTPPPPNNEESLNNEELLKSLKDLTDRLKKLEVQLEDLEPLIKISRCIGFFFRKSSNDTQENSKDAQRREEALKGVKEENAKLNRERTDLLRENQNLTKEKAELTEKNQKLTNEKAELTDKNKELDDQVGLLKGQIKSLEQSQQALKNENTDLKTENQKLTTEKTELTEKNQKLTTEKENLNNQLNASQKQIKSLEQCQQVLENEKDGLLKEKENLTKANTALTEKNKTLTTEKENLTTDLSNARSQVIQANQEKDKLEQKHAPYKKLERLYEVFLEVKECLNFGFVKETHSAMDLIASVLSDSKYYLESLYNKASQELSDKKSDKGEKLAELFDLLFEYVKDNKFECLKEPIAYDSTCKKLYPEQNTSGKMQRVVLIGYTYDKKTTYYTIVDMGS